MINKRYYEKLGGFAYLLGELRKKLSKEQTDVLIQDAVELCNKLCAQYQDLSKKEKLHTERMIFPRAAIYLQMIQYIPHEEAGFKAKELESDSRHYRVDVLQCPYMKYCELLGCKELTETFCLSDDRVYGNLCGITFERQGTIGRGSEKCDFYFYRDDPTR